MPTPNRVIRVSDELWFAAQEEAVARGETVTDVIVRTLIRYTTSKRPARRKPTRPTAQAVHGSNTLAAIKRRETKETKDELP